MARRKSFKGLIDSGEKSDSRWFAFPIIGFLLVLITCWIGGSLLMNNTFIGLFIALFFCICLFFISQYLEKSKVDGDNQILLWIAYVIVGLTATSVGYHYLHTFHSNKATFFSNQEAVIKEKVDLMNDYMSLTRQVSALSQCESEVLTENAAILRKELDYYQTKSRNLRSPIQFLLNQGKTSQERSYSDIKGNIEASIDNYKMINSGSCANIQLPPSIVSSEGTSSPIAGTNSISSSLANANWFWFLGLFLISSFLILIPFFIADGAIPILIRR